MVAAESELQTLSAVASTAASKSSLMWSLETEVSASGSAAARGTRCAVVKASMISPLPSDA